MGEKDTADVVVKFEDMLTLKNVKFFKENLPVFSGDSILLDVSTVTKLDTSAAQLLFCIVASAREDGIEVKWSKIPSYVEEILLTLGLKEIIMQ